jgi:succinoglycan biosynthesis protein ExoA
VNVTAQDIQVSVLIPVLNEETHLLEAARAMLAQELAGAAEFLFIDGGSHDASLEILESLRAADPRVRVLPNPARRTPQALNIGLRAARGEFVARMDAHTIYPERYLASGMARLQAGGVEWVSGPQLAIGTDPGSARIARALSTSLGKGGARYRDALSHEHEVDSGFTGMWRREVLVRHNGWDEAWLNDQDLELAARIRKAGGRIVCIPEMAARYVPRATPAKLARQYLTYGTYRVKTARRHPETLRRSQILPPCLAGIGALSVAFPRPRVKKTARAGLGVYTAILLVAGSRVNDGPAADRLLIPMVWATMHLSYGVGFLRGCARYGVPVSAVWGLMARRRPSADDHRPGS